MNKRTSFSFLTFFALIALASPLSANSFLYVGVLEDEGTAFDGILNVEIVVEVEGASIWSETQAGVVVVDGVFAVDIGSSEPLPPSIPATGELIFLIEGEALPPIPLATVYRVERAQRALEASFAAAATLLRGEPAAAFSTVESLVTPGGAQVNFANLTSVPEDLIDGDTGTDITVPLGTGLELNEAGTLRVLNIPGDRFADNTVQWDVVGGNNILGAKVAPGAVTASKVSSGSFVAAQLNVPLTSREISSRQVLLADPRCLPTGTITIQRGCACNSPSEGNFCQNVTLAGSVVRDQ